MNGPQGPIFTETQHQYCDNSAMTLVILVSLKTMELLKNGLQPHSGVTPLFSMTTVSLASSQSCEAWTLTPNVNRPLLCIVILGSHISVFEFQTETSASRTRVRTARLVLTWSGTIRAAVDLDSGATTAKVRVSSTLNGKNHQHV